MAYGNEPVDRETTIRKNVLKSFNKRPDDFNSLREYNDYLEEVEDIIYNLVNGIDVEETNNKISEYIAKNKSLIARNKAKIQEETNKKREEERRKEQMQLENASTQPAPKTTQQLATGSFVPPGGAILPVRQPAMKPNQQPQKVKETEEVVQKRAIAGGYKMNYPLKKAEEEAFSTVFIVRGL